MKHCTICGQQAEQDGQLQCECSAALPPVRVEAVVVHPSKAMGFMNGETPALYRLRKIWQEKDKLACLASDQLKDAELAFDDAARDRDKAFNDYVSERDRHNTTVDPRPTGKGENE